jgi:hypothetical protein
VTPVDFKRELPTYPPAAFFLREQTGLTGRSVAAAQAFLRRGSHWTHAGFILDNQQIAESQPQGVVIRPLSVLLDDRPLLISDAPMQIWLANNVQGENRREVEAGKRRRIVRNARAMEGTPYSWLDYLALAWAEWKLPGWKLLRNYVEDSGHLICSAYVDRVYSDSGIHLYTDPPRLPGDVTPGDLDLYDDLWRQSVIEQGTRD